MAVPHFEQCLSILKLLELHVYYPKKITREMALTVPGEVIARKDLNKTCNQPWFMLQNIIAGNYEGMSFAINTQTSVSESRGPETLLSNYLQGRKPTDSGCLVNPLDVLTSLFICCDDFLRQMLVEKLSNCQLGIPLLLPVIDATPQTSGVEMLSWATSTIRKQWKTASGQPVEQSMAVHPLPIVSALRIGRPRLSKSKILNETMNSKHDHFFHSKCTGGSVRKIVSNGIVELMWYLPVGSDRDSFPGAFGVMNLRGNAVNHSLQRTFLTKASSTAIIFCQRDMSNKEEIYSITSRNDQHSHLILVFDENPNEEWFKTLEHVLPAYKNEGKQVHVLTDNYTNNVADKVREAINMCMSNDFADQTTSKSLEDCEIIASHADIRIDEKDYGDNYECKLKAVDLLVCLQAEHDKDKHLPLQAISRKIALKTYEQIDMKFKDMSTESYIYKMDSEIMDLRKKQSDLWKDKSEMIMVKKFLESVAFTSLGRSYFYNWMGTMLDRHSIHNLQLIRENKPTSMNNSEIVEEFQRKLSNASLGLEHLNREIAQIYEMASELSRMESDIQTFPEIAAHMLIDGQPLEIMDGDATYVPTTWLKAVFNCLKARIGNKKLFVLSVVGVQGSGKSTMLNTMFGLKFAVGAGRCTRGAFAQLVPLDEDLKKKYKSDYIMVIDTEGLCAPEFAGIDDNNKRDNKLATFIIALADCTIINVMADNQAGIQDILQIAVYALMKMESTNIKPSCIFVHQCKGDLLTSEKNITSDFHLKKVLDKSTRIAADIQKTSFKSFEEVISFQPEKHVVYIPNLWQEHPPMATTNPEYIRNVLELRNLAFSVMGGHSNSIDEFSFKFTGVSKAVLYEEFAFSFIHAVEIHSYNGLENEYIDASRDFRRTCMSNQHAFVNACKNMSAAKIKEEGTQILEVYTRKLDKCSEILRNRMKEYICKNPKAAQWEARINSRLYELILEMRKTLRKEFEIVKQAVIWKTKIEKGYLQEIYQKSGELAKKLRADGTSESELETEFNRCWEEWINNTPKLTELIDIETTLEGILRKTGLDDKFLTQNILSMLTKKQNVDVSLDDVIENCSASKCDLRNIISNIQEMAIASIDDYRDKGSSCDESIIQDVVNVVYNVLQNP
ncbi:interferon-induced very large GTPase 1-like [Antedon mediterranea]|uniref:interferon-induced very large GTPase 1-like n=1 Tax=Antedon mediterranea TaxID=105859 RepID=UPI003AF74CC7